jgi:multidrug resistance protein
LTCAVFQPFIAALSDIFGRQELLLLSLLFFTVGSLLCGSSWNFPTLLIGRCIQGVGGGGVITLAQVIFADIVPLRQRPKWFSLVLAAWALGSVIGPLVGGLFVQHGLWRWTFYINLPFCGIGFVMVPLFIRLTTQKTSLKEKLLRVDWVGGFLFISSMTSFLIGLSWGGVEFAWTSFQTLVPLIVGVAGVALSLLWERYGAREAFLRRSLFHNGSAVAAYICALLQGLLVSFGHPSERPSAFANICSSSVRSIMFLSTLCRSSSNPPSPPALISFQSHVSYYLVLRLSPS